MDAVERFALRVEEGAEAIGVSRAKMYEEIKKGTIPSVRIGGCLRIPVAALRDFIARQIVAATTDAPSSTDETTPTPAYTKDKPARRR